MNSPTKKLQKNPNTCATFIDDELIVMNAQDNIYYKINAAGIKIWQLLDRQASSLDAIVDFVAAAYQLPKARVHPDVLLFVNAMLNKNILQYT